MSEKNYPPLPKPALKSTQLDSTMRYTILDSFSEDQMRAYVDADRAQRGSEQEAQYERAPMQLTWADIKRLVQWFGAVEDLNTAYLEREDRALVQRLKKAERAQCLPLTDVQVLGVLTTLYPGASWMPGGWLEFARAIEAAHGIGGHGVNKGETK